MVGWAEDVIVADGKRSILSTVLKHLEDWLKTVLGFYIWSLLQIDWGECLQSVACGREGEGYLCARQGNK